MADEAPITEAPVEEPKVPAVEDEDERDARLREMRKHKKASDDRAKTLQRELEDLKAQMEDRDSANLPELERERKAREKLERQLEEIAGERDQVRAEAQRVRAEGWIAAAARDANFEDPEDAILRINAGEVESIEDAAREVKRLAKAKPRLVKQDEPRLPGQVLKDGQRPSASQTTPGVSAPGSAFGVISTEEEANAIGEALQAFRKTRQSTRITFGA
jgi:hypothetical protein